MSNTANQIPSVPHESYLLANGLTVVLAPRPGVPLVAVNINYRVGSKDERPGRTGLAHLFEHLMFQGSKHFNDDYFKALQDVGGAVNGATNPDRTRYWELLPSAYLERALWLESDRMGFFLDGLTPERLDNQRSVVLNERRQNYDNRPYGLVWEKLLALLYPPHHPYHWPTIGFAADIAAATLEQAREFFLTHYGPNNSSLCIVGDIQLDATKELVEKYFDPLPPGPPTLQLARWVPPSPASEVSLALEDRVQLPRTYLAWPTVPLYDPDDAALDAFAHILGQGRTSRLYRRLVYELGIAQEATAAHWSQQLAGAFTVVLTPRPGHSLERVEGEARRVLEELQEHGPTADELQRVAAVSASRLTRSLQSVGGFDGLSDRLNHYLHYLGEPDRFRWDLQRTLELTPEVVRQAGRRYLGEGRVAVRVRPRPRLAGTPSPVALDRAVMPGPGIRRPLSLPSPRRLTLPNGLEVLHAERGDVPILAAVLVVRGGAVNDPPELPGLAALTAAVLPEGAGERDALAMAEALERCGAHLEVAPGPDATFLTLSALSAHAGEALALLADVAARPHLAAEEVERQRVRRLVQLRQLLDQPDYLARAAARQALFGQHPYGRPTLGTPAGVGRAGVDEVRVMWTHLFAPGNATLVVVGDIAVEELERVLDATLAGWAGEARVIEPPPTPLPTPRAVSLVDRPGAPQSVACVSLPGPARATPHHPALEVLNTAFGGQFVSRLNLNLREEKGYTYGIRSHFAYRRWAGEWVIATQVETRVAAAALREILNELEALAGARPLTAEEVAYASGSLINGHPRGFETPAQVARALAEVALHGLPEGTLESFPARVAEVTPAQLAELAADIARPSVAAIAIVGDRAALEADLAALEVGPVVAVDPQTDQL